MNLALTLTFLLCTQAWGPGVAGESCRGTAADANAAGFRLGRVLLQELEDRSVRLRPGPVNLTTSGRVRPAVAGLARALSPRGFHLVDAVDGPRGVLALRLSLVAGDAGSTLSLSCPEHALGPYRIEVVDKPWVGADRLPPEQVRVQGSWEVTRDKALAVGRGRARRDLADRFLAPLPWRPWTRPNLARLLEEEGLETDLFLERQVTGQGPLWRAWILADLEGARAVEVRRLLAHEDGRWYGRLGAGLLAALLLWGLAWRVDWATRGYFTGRVRLTAFLVWVGVCVLLGIVL